MGWLIGLLLIVAALVIWYVALGLRLKPMTNRAREAAPGETVTVPGGILHIRWDGPEDGPVVVMVHGFSTPHFIFEQNVSALTERGYRVLRYDHFGRGWSDRPSGPYDADFYDETLLALLDTLKLTRPVSLVGLSMGGPIVSEFAARRPDRVERLFLFVPAGLDVSGSNGLAAKLMRIPAVGDLLWRVVGQGVLLGDPQYDETGLPEDRRLKGDIRDQMQYRGYLDALLSTLRHMPLTRRDDLFTRLRATGLPVAAVFGADDPTVLPSSAERLGRLIPEAQIHLLDDADHGLNYKRHDAANPLLTAFFPPV